RRTGDQRQHGRRHCEPPSRLIYRITRTSRAVRAKLADRRGGQRPAEAMGPTVRAAIDSYLDSPDVRANPNTLRAYTSVLDRVGEGIGTRRRLAEVLDHEIASALTG